MLLEGDLQQIREIGEKLARVVAETGLSVDSAVVEVFGRHSDLSKATATVAVRWVNGDLGNDFVAKPAIAKIKHSVLARMPAEIVRDVVGGTHTFVSKDENRVVTKTFFEASAAEISSAVTVRGVKSVGGADGTIVYRSFRHVPPELKTRNQWQKLGTEIPNNAKPKALVKWEGRKVPLFDRHGTIEAEQSS